MTQRLLRIWNRLDNRELPDGYISWSHPRQARHLTLVSALVLTLAFTFSAARADQRNPVGGASSPDVPLMTGSEITVTVADYHQALLALTPKQRQLIEGNATRQRELLFEVYVEKLLAREARRRGLDQQPEALAQLEQASRKILVNAVVKQEKTNVDTPDLTALAEEYYLTHKKEFVRPKRVKIAHILWQVRCECEDQDGKKRTQAEAALAELRAGADFADLARKYSDDKSTAEKGGEMEQWVTQGMLVDPLNTVAFTLTEPGALSAVVKSEYGYHVLKLIAHEPAGVQPFDEVKDRIVNQLASKYKTVAHKAFVAQYYPTALEFNDAAINALPVKVTD